MKALNLSKELRGECSYHTIEIYINIADNYQKLGDIQKAEENFKMCLSLFEQQNDHSIGSRSHSSPSLIHRLAITMRLKQEYEMAALLLEKVIQVKVKLLGTEEH